MSLGKVILVRPHPGAIANVVGIRLPLALLRLGSVLDPDYHVVIIDMGKDAHWRVSLQRELTCGRPLVMGIGTMTGPQLLGALEASELCRQVAPQVKVVWGGVHPSLFPEAVASDPLVDAAVIGEGETTLRELVDAIEGGGPWNTIPGLAYMEDGQLTTTGRRPFMDLDTLPPLPLHLVNPERYMFTDFGASRLLELETSRGCPFACEYCYNNTFNQRRWRSMSAHRVLDEIQRLRRDYGVRGLGFVDDEFFIDPKRAHTFAEGMLRLDLDFKLLFQGLRVDTLSRMSDDTLDLLDRCGTLSIQLGIESGSQRILDSIGKNMTLELALEQNRRLARCREIRPYYNFMAGFPDETPDDIRASVRLGWQLLQDNPRARLGPYHILVTYPGSALFDRAVREGFEPPQTAAGWARFDFHSARPPWVGDEVYDLARRITVASVFVDDKVLQRTTSRAAQLFTRLYRPLARWRFAHQQFRRMPERHLFKLLERPTARKKHGG